MSTAEMMSIYLDEEVTRSYEVSYTLEWEEGEDTWRKPWLTWYEHKECKVPFVGAPADLRDFIAALNERPRGCGWVSSVKVAEKGRI